MKNRKTVWFIAGALALFVVAACLFAILRLRDEPQPGSEACVQPVNLLFGIPRDPYEVVDSEVESGQSLSVLLSSNGVSAARIDVLDRTPGDIFDPRSIRAGHDYHLFFTADSLRNLDYMVYQESRICYVVFDLRRDSITVSRFCKDVEVKRLSGGGQINSSLWNCMVDNGMSPGLAMELSEIYAWSIDFFGLRKGDSFKVIYDESFVDSTSVGAGMIWGAVFTHSGKDYYAIPFKQGKKISYWDENGNSLRKNLLKAPLKYSRISSRFSNGRLHPVLRIVRPHHGVDYAAPSGTPVVAVADGTVVSCGWGGGGGNSVKIRHSGGLQSGYLHLKGYAKGIRTGVHVSQGQLIGYVGSTGLSTGPHLDFRLWKGGKPIDPLKAPTEPAEPISAANRADFEIVKQRVMAELAGALPDSLKITRLDSLNFHTPATDGNPAPNN